MMKEEFVYEVFENMIRNTVVALVLKLAKRKIKLL